MEAFLSLFYYTFKKHISTDLRHNKSNPYFWRSLIYFSFCEFAQIEPKQAKAIIRLATNRDNSFSQPLDHDFVPFTVGLFDDATIENHTSLAQVSSWGHTETARCLLEMQFNTDVKGGLALVSAAENGHIETVKLLLEHGASATAHDNAAIKRAHSRKFHEIFELLECHGARIRPQTGWISEKSYKLVACAKLYRFKFQLAPEGTWYI